MVIHRQRKAKDARAKFSRRARRSEDSGVRIRVKNITIGSEYEADGAQPNLVAVLESRFLLRQDELAGYERGIARARLDLEKPVPSRAIDAGVVPRNSFAAFERAKI